jgi:drug/metabolite transporter (DMT)-like permease
MPLPVIGLVLLAAFLHATWNFLVKRLDDKHISMTAVVLGHAPFALAALCVAPLPKPDSLPYILAGAALHVGYQLFLLASYRVGDLSQVYPLARGVAPLIVAGVSVALLGMALSPMELLAVTTIGIGIMSFATVRGTDGIRNGQVVVLAIVTGTFIAGYSLVDGIGARVAGSALGFYGVLSVINSVVFAILMRWMRPGIVTRALRQEWRLVLGGGGASVTAYALVIWAFTLAPIALVTALRETSILFALMLGVAGLKERLGGMKVVSTLLTIAGVALLCLHR